MEHDAIELATSYSELDEETEKVRVRYQELYKSFKEKTDEEKKKVIEAGGLCIIGTERHESRRIDNQLRGRSGRQGDVGCSIFFLSLEDDLMMRFGGERMKRIYAFSKMEEDECLESRLLARLVEYAQKQIEGRNFSIRKNVLQYDDVMNTQRKIIYAERMNVIKGESVHDQVVKYIPDYVRTTVHGAVNADEMPEKWNEEDLNVALERKLLPEGTNYVTREQLEKWDYDVAIKKISDKVEKYYEEKIANIQAETPVNFGDVERRVLLRVVDSNWIDHIDAMDRLRKGIGLRAYGQTDPVIAYKQEGFAMFDEMIERIQERAIAILLKAQIEMRQAPVTRVMPTANVRTAPKKEEAAPEEKEAPAPEEQADAAVPAMPAAVNVDSLKTNGESKFNPATVKKTKKVGPNDPCPCGSGLKYKKCHGKP